MHSEEPCEEAVAIKGLVRTGRRTITRIAGRLAPRGRPSSGLPGYDSVQASRAALTLPSGAPRPHGTFRRPRRAPRRHARRSRPYRVRTPPPAFSCASWPYRPSPEARSLFDSGRGRDPRELVGTPETLALKLRSVSSSIRMFANVRAYDQGRLEKRLAEQRPYRE